MTLFYMTYEKNFDMFISCFQLVLEWSCYKLKEGKNGMNERDLIKVVISEIRDFCVVVVRV